VLLQIIIVDYFFIKRGNIHTPSLFDPSPTSLYYYTKGWNFKAVGCWVCAAAFGVPGLIGAYHPSWVGIGAIEIYHSGWVICFAIAGSFYYAINVLLPPRIYPEGSQITGPMKFEGLAEAEGYLEGESIITFVTTDEDGSEKLEKV
jgi:NCS1 family nucleobase:cation symporter-1